MVYCVFVGYCVVAVDNHSNKKYTTEKASYFRLPSDESLRRTWLSKIKRQDLQQIMIAFAFVMYNLKKISFNAIYRYVVFFICPLKFCLRLFHSMVLMYGNK